MFGGTMKSLFKSGVRDLKNKFSKAGEEEEFATPFGLRIGAAVDVATDPKGEIEANKIPQIVTVYAEAEGLQKVIPWKQGLTVYSASRLAKMKGAVGSCKIERGDETMAGNFQTVLEPGDVLRFGNP